MATKRPARALLAASVLAYAICLPQDSFCTGAQQCSDWPGWSLLLFGWMGIFSGLAAFAAWLANPVLLIAWLLTLMGSIGGGLWFKTPAVLAAAASLGLALSFRSITTLVLNEGGSASAITGYGAGYWWWVGSAALALVSAIWLPQGGRIRRAEGAAPPT